MAVEIESKIKVGDHEPVRRRLRESGGEYVGRALEINRLFDDAQATLLASGCGLRVRECQALDGVAPGATLTYKGPQREGVFKRRIEVQVEIGDAGAMTEILHSLGFSERILFEKRRESWRFRGCAVELDEVPELGLFVEVEGASEEAIHAVLAWLGLDASASIRASYVALLVQGRPEPVSWPLAFRFEA